MSPIVFGNPRVIQFSQLLGTPALSAIHAVGVKCGSEKVLTGASFACIPLAVALFTANHLSVRTIVGFDAERTRFDVSHTVVTCRSF